MPTRKIDVATHPDPQRLLARLQGALAERSLEEYLVQAWTILEPETPLARDWYIGYLTEHLEAVTMGQIRELICCIPPRHTKSLIFSVCWPTWEWGPRDMGHTKWIYVSYGDTLSADLSVKRRLLIQSAWYQERWGRQFRLAYDVNRIRQFANTRGGEMIASPIMGQILGKGANRIVIDDPIDPAAVESELDRSNVMRVIQRVLPSRRNNPAQDAQVCVMQRLDLRDPAGYFKEMGWHYVGLPGWARPTRTYSYPQTYTYPVTGRTHTVNEGDVLSPSRVPPEEHAKIRKSMGPRAYSAQYDQEPVPEDGKTLQRPWFQLRNALPHHGFRKVIRYWDLAGTQGGGKRTAGAKVGKAWDNSYWLLHMRKGHWGEANREAVISSTIAWDGPDVETWMEQEPGSSGTEAANATIRRNAGALIRKDRVTGSKETRARVLAGQAEAGNFFVFVWDPEEVEDFIREAEQFPFGEFSDQVDSASGGLIKCALLPDVGGYAAGDPPETPRQAGARIGDTDIPTDQDFAHAGEQFGSL